MNFTMDALQKYLRDSKDVPTSAKDNLDIHIIDWWAEDETPETESDESMSENDDKCVHCSRPSPCSCILDTYAIRCFGVTKQGYSVTCKITDFKPFYYIKVDNNFDRVKLHHFLDYVQSSFYLKAYPNALVKEHGKHKSCIVSKKDLFGFRNGKHFKFVKLVFSNHTALMKSRYIFKKPAFIPHVTSKPTKFKLYESNFEGFMRYCHIKDIAMAGWIRLPAGKYSITEGTATTNLEVEIDRRAVVSLRHVHDMAPFLQASWDIEVYSHDYSFPNPQKKVKTANGITYPNEIFQIATTYKYHGQDNVHLKHLLTLKKCAPLDDVERTVVEECANEKELIKRWVDTISAMDPDIFYTYNGDSFDCMYLVERAIIHDLLAKSKKSGYILDKLSRLTDKQCVLKKEYFSSSAYGDSEFIRLYFPGRLNYDLMIHYKRGMKKYPSYKLDYIANEILREGKHDVSAKEIFSYYEEGTPEKIKHIGKYCLQDTELLQKLVDKQLILTNIMQLANVTFVPIGFLTTRGQTIKVYSQLLRKARQMDFVVPHTNFNEDSYPFTLKMDEANVFTDESIGDYITINMGSEAKRAETGVITSTHGNSINITCDHDIEAKYFRGYIKKGHLCGSITDIKNDDTPTSVRTILTVSLFPSPTEVDHNIQVGDKLYFDISIPRPVSGRIFEIVDEHTVIALCDDEISEFKYNKTLVYNRTTHSVAKLWQNRDAIDDSFTGATVLEPCTGMYTDNIAVLDFASLYPTIQISRNVCYSTYVMDPKYLGEEGVKYETIAWDDKIEFKMKETCQGVGKTGACKGRVCGKQAYFLVDDQYYCRIHDPAKKTRQPNEKHQMKDVQYSYVLVQPTYDDSGNVVNKGVIPSLLEDLYFERKQVKKQMAQALQNGNKHLADILDSTQLAIKISLNSVYGFLGRNQGNLICKPLGQITTALGRMLIEQSKEYAETPFLQHVKDANLLVHQLQTTSCTLDEKEQQDILQKFRKTDF